MNIQSIDFVHPELKDGEVFFTNSNLREFEKMKFKTKRLGRLTFTGKGEQQFFQDWYPVFINYHDVEYSGLSLRELRRKYWQ